MPNFVIAALLAAGEYLAMAYAVSAATYTLLYYAPIVIAAAIAVGYTVNQISIAKRRALNAYNSSLTDRLASVNTTESPRELVLGRVRKSGALFFRGSAGVNNSKFFLCIALAGHEIDAVESYYLNDLPVTVDGSGYVTTAPYVQGETISGEEFFSPGTTSVTLPYTPIAGSVFAVINGEYGLAETPGPFTVVGNVVTFEITPLQYGVVAYQSSSVSSLVRLRSYLGTPGQTADETLIAAFPTLWTNDHKATGVPYIIAEYDFDENAFPTGLPAVTAVVRGAKIYDPSTTATVWTENPALMQRHVLLHPYFGKRSFLTPGEETRINQARADCAANESWVINGAAPVNYNRYRAALIAPYGAQTQAVLDDLASAMGGRWAHAQGQFFVKAGVFSASVKTIQDEDLVGLVTNAEGQENSAGISISTHRPRADKFNVVNVRIWDSAQDYKEVPLTPLKGTALIAKDREELAQEFRLVAVPYSYQALHIAGVMMRDARDPLLVTIVCKLTVYQVELFDTVALSIARYGWSLKLFEVLSRKWAGQGTLQLVLKETSASIYDKDSNFVPGGFASNTSLTTPFAIPKPIGLTAVSGTNQLERLADGTILTRVLVTWTATTDRAVLENGWIDIAYQINAGGVWIQDTVDGDRQSLYIRAAPDRAVLAIRARYRNALTTGDWCTQIVHDVVGKTEKPANPTGFSFAKVFNGIQFTWTTSTEIDYSQSIIHIEAVWVNATVPLFSGPANKFLWYYPGPGTYTVLLKHQDTSGNLSATAASVTFTVSVDSLLSREEKPDIILDYNIIIAEKPGINARATAYAITTENTTYNSSVAALTTYLTGLSPAYTDLNTNTPIVGTELRTAFYDVFVARQSLLNKIAEISGTRATWTGLGASVPTNLATAGASPSSPVLNSALVVNLNGSLNAGSGAPNLANIAGRIVASQFGDDFLIINDDGDDITVEMRWNRTTGGWASIYWDGVNMTTNKPFIPQQLGINQIAGSLPASPFAYQVAIIP